MTTTIPEWVIAAVISLIGVAFTGMGFFYARVKSAEHKAREDGVVFTKLESLDKKMDAMSLYTTTQQNICINRGERLVLVEASVKLAHESIAKLEKNNRTVRRAVPRGGNNA